jgi:hypothetical protein
MRVLRQNDVENDNYILHDFNSGFIDLDDFQDLLKQQMPADVRNDDDVLPIFTAATTLYGAITQAALIGHAIAERYLMKDYEQYIAKRNKISVAEYEGTYRPWGDKRAGQILKEMVRTTDTGWDKNVSTCEYTKQESLGVRIQFYPNKASWALAILLYSSSNPKKWDEINSGYLQKKN